MDPTAIPWEKLADFGLPTVLLFAVLWLLYRAVSRAWTDVLMPLKERLVKFLDSLEDSLKKLVQKSEDWKCNYPQNGCQNYVPTDQPKDPIPNRLHPRESGAK